MTEFRKQYQSKPVDFHLWPQDKIAELWWKFALEWVKSRSGVAKNLYMIDVNELDEELEA